MRSQGLSSRVLAGLALALIVGASWLTVHRADREMRAELLQQAMLVAKAVDISHIQALSGTEADLDNPHYRVLKEHLVAVHSSSPLCRFIYLMGRRDGLPSKTEAGATGGTIFFFADSEAVGSKDYSPPGQVFDESTAGLHRVFNTKGSLVEGPVSDSWGTWISALAPLIDPRTGAVVAVLGMDIDARTWGWDVATRVALPIGFMLTLLIVAVSLVVSSRRVHDSPKPVLRFLLPPLSSLAILLFLGVGLLFWQQHRQLLAREISADTADITGDLRVAMEQQSLGLAVAAKCIASDGAVQKALREGDTARLLTVWRPVFETLRLENKLTHFYFFDTNRVCLLRLHRLEKRGDIVRHFTAITAEHTGKPSSGIELGPFGTFTLRVVQPVSQGTHLVGYVELGKEIEDALKALNARSGNPIAVTLRKEHLDRQAWEDGMSRLGKEADWGRLPHSVVIYSSLGRLPDAFAPMADHDASVSPAQRGTDVEIAYNGGAWRVSTTPLQDASGKEVGDLLIMRDITAAKVAFARLLILSGTVGGVLLILLLGFIYVLLRRTDVGIQAQQTALSESERKYRDLVENMQAGVVAHGPDSGVLYSNPMASQLLGLTPDQMRGKTATDPDWCFIREDGSRMPLDEYPVNRALATAAPLSNMILGILGAGQDGPIWVQCDTHSIRNLDGELQQVVVTFFDITARKRSEAERERLEEQLRQAQKMESVGRLAGGVAHDFNNMLGVILGHVEMAIEQVSPTLPLYADLEEINKAAKRSANLTRQLLAFGRKQTIAPKPLDLNETVECMLTMLKRLIGENIDLVWLPKVNLWPVKVDPSQIDQVLANLCVNARDAISGVGNLTIETENCVLDASYCALHVDVVPGDYVLLTLSDSGCGMDKETQSHLFEPFFTTKDVGKGTGLGLATVYGIVKQNNGTINVYSEPGKGTSFKIYLPRYVGKAGQAQAEDAERQTLRGTETILLAEDELAILKMTAVILERQGYTVLAASTPGEAIRLAREHAGEIHLLMTDVIMPEMNGRYLAKNLQAFCPNIKCLFTSGYTANVIAHHGVLDEGVHFIQKPVSLRDLSAKVREILDGN